LIAIGLVKVAPWRVSSLCIAALAWPYYTRHVKTLTVRVPAPLVAEIAAESRGRKITKSDVIRERLQRAPRSKRRPASPLDAIADLIGSIDTLPADLSARKKRYLKTSGYGRTRAR